LNIAHLRLKYKNSEGSVSNKNREFLSFLETELMFHSLLDSEILAFLDRKCMYEINQNDVDLDRASSINEMLD
jgi:hypothetical protein